MFGDQFGPKLRGNQPPQTFGSQANQTLATNLGLTAATLTTVLSLTLGPGTYLLFGGVTIGSAMATVVEAKIVDLTAGTTIGSAAAVNTAAYSTTLNIAVPLVLTATHNIALQGECSGTGTVFAATSYSSFPNATRLFAVQIAGGVMQLPPTIASAPAFVSAAQAPAASTLYSVAHGLGRIPNMGRAILLCTTANLGYSVGDIVDVSTLLYTSAYYNGSTGWNSTNIFYSSGAAGFAFINKGTGGVASVVTNADWSLYLQAW